MKGMEQRNSSIEIYRSPEGNIELNVKLENDTVWLTQSQMAELFGRDRTVISRHVNNCFKEGELDPNITCAKFAHMGIEGDQTFGGEELYASVEEKAAMLLYLVVKNHSFSDGNKRIAAMLFLWFMEKNGILYAENGHKRIADNTLVALTLMIAESRTEEKDVMVKVVVNLINKDNQ